MFVNISLQIQPSPQHLFDDETLELETSPPVGMKRSYAPPTLEFIDKWQKEQKIHAPHVQLVSPRSVMSSRMPLRKTSTPRIKSAPPAK